VYAVQVEYSPFTLDIEDESIGFLKTARELEVKIIAYSPLGRGPTISRYICQSFPRNNGNFRKHVPRYSKQNFPNAFKLTDGLKETGEKYSVTVG
ncbi:hypothetical protein BDM02DRAFT_3151326, partial [Thelephora ganbajun]